MAFKGFGKRVKGAAAVLEEPTVKDVLEMKESFKGIVELSEVDMTQLKKQAIGMSKDWEVYLQEILEDAIHNELYGYPKPRK